MPKGETEQGAPHRIAAKIIFGKILFIFSEIFFLYGPPWVPQQFIWRRQPVLSSVLGNIQIKIAKM